MLTSPLAILQRGVLFPSLPGLDLIAYEDAEDVASSGAAVSVVRRALLQDLHVFAHFLGVVHESPHESHYSVNSGQSGEVSDQFGEVASAVEAVEVVAEVDSVLQQLGEDVGVAGDGSLDVGDQCFASGNEGLGIGSALVWGVRVLLNAHNEPIYEVQHVSARLGCRKDEEETKSQSCRSHIFISPRPFMETEALLSCGGIRQPHIALNRCRNTLSTHISS